MDEESSLKAVQVLGAGMKLNLRLEDLYLCLGMAGLFTQSLLGMDQIRSFFFGHSVIRPEFIS